MNQYLLLPAFFICCVGSWLSYTDAKSRSGAPYLFGCLAAACGVLWGFAVRGASPAQVMALSVIYDGLMVLAYYALPLVLLDVRPTWNVYAGLGLVVFGMILAKWG